MVPSKRRHSTISSRSSLQTFVCASLCALVAFTRFKFIGQHTQEFKRGVSSVCFASHEIKCFTKNAGGLGRAFFEQALLAKRLNYRLTVILLSVIPEPDSTLVNLCPDNTDAVLLQENTVLPGFVEMNVGDFPFHHAPMQLLKWMEANHDVCDVLHVADFLGEGAMVALAKRAGVPFMRPVAITVQVHGSDAVIFHETSMALQRSHIYVHALERLQMKHADSVVFLSEENANRYQKFWDLPRDIAIIPNIVKLLPSKTFPGELSRTHVHIRHIIFYGKMTEAKGIKIFVKALALCLSKDVRNLTVHLVGMRFDEVDYLESLRSFAAQHDVSLVAKYDLNTWECIEFLHQHRYDGVAILPSYVEHQSFALFDVFLSQISFLASDIHAHRSQIPEYLHDDVLFALVPTSLAQKITKILREGIRTNVNTPGWVPVGTSERLWEAWYAKRTKGPLKKRHNHGPHTRFTVTVINCDPERMPFLKRALMSILAQDYPLRLIDILLVHHGVPNSRFCEQSSALLDSKELRPSEMKIHCMDTLSDRSVMVSKGRALNFAISTAASNAVLLMADTDELKVRAISSYARALAENSHAGIFTSFADLYEPTSAAATLKEQPSKLHQYFNPAIEIGLFDEMPSELYMMINKASTFWRNSNGFTEDLSMNCESWSMLQRAAMVDSLILVPQTLVMRQTFVDDLTGWSIDAGHDKYHIQNVRCHTKLIENVALFTGTYPERVDMRNLLTPLLYSHALHVGSHDDR